MDKKYVDVDNVLNELFNLYDSINPNTITGNDARNKIFKSYKTIESLSNKDVQEVRHGEWIVTNTEFAWNNGEFPTEWRCSHCSNIVFEGGLPYCPYCGCKMMGDDN